MKRIATRLLLGGGALLIAPAAYADWMNEPPSHHSGLASQDDTIWDNELANWISQYFTNGYSHMKFMFGQCYSGGFINDLKDFSNVVIGTASDYDHTSTYVNATGDSYQQRWTDFVDGNDPGDTMRNAHDTAKIYAPEERPQYYSNPPALGNSLKLKNDGEMSWHAVLYVGTYTDEDQKNYYDRLTEEMFETLRTDYGYPAANIDILFGNDPSVLNTPGAVTKTATWENLRSTLQAVGDELNSQEQFFFWAIDHGTEIPMPSAAALLLLGTLGLLHRRR
jgi:uncharacterized protein (TIGR03382 family)